MYILLARMHVFSTICIAVRKHAGFTTNYCFDEAAVGSPPFLDDLVYHIFESRQGLSILSCEEAIQLAYGTSVVLLRCPFVPEIILEMAPEVFLYQ
jgi:hypothetical protein